MSDVFEKTSEFLQRVMKLKAKMIEKKLVLARAKCTIGGCDGEIVARLAGRKNHVHAACRKCGLSMME